MGISLLVFQCSFRLSVCSSVSLKAVRGDVREAQDILLCTVVSLMAITSFKNGLFNSSFLFQRGKCNRKY